MLQAYQKYSVSPGLSDFTIYLWFLNESPSCASESPFKVFKGHQKFTAPLSLEHLWRGAGRRRAGSRKLTKFAHFDNPPGESHKDGIKHTLASFNVKRIHPSMNICPQKFRFQFVCALNNKVCTEVAHCCAKFLWRLGGEIFHLVSSSFI